MRHRLPTAIPRIAAFWGAALWLGVAPLAAQQPSPAMDTGWVCGAVVDEANSLIADARLTLIPATPAEKADADPVAETATDNHGMFCLRGLDPGFYQLRASKAGWPEQPARRVEVRAGLVNHLNPFLELQLEPGEPSVHFAESFDGMSDVEARAVMERLLARGDTKSIKELARRLLPKRGVRIDLNRIVLGLDIKPLVEELIRQMEEGYLPPLKTARYLYCVGQLADARTQDAATRLLLRKLRDGRALPNDPATGEPRGYVSDHAMYALERLAGERFEEWEYGKPPIQNRKAITAAQNWWQREQDQQRRDRNRR